MSDELFSLPEAPPDPLVIARKRFEEADKAFALSNDCEDEFGDPVPGEVSKEYREAKQQLANAERNELLKQTLPRRETPALETEA